MKAEDGNLLKKRPLSPIKGVKVLSICFEARGRLEEARGRPSNETRHPAGVAYIIGELILSSE